MIAGYRHAPCPAGPDGRPFAVRGACRRVPRICCSIASATMSNRCAPRPASPVSPPPSSAPTTSSGSAPSAGRTSTAAIATRTDTPFHVDGLTQMFTATLVLRCVEEGRLSLDDRIGQFNPSSPERERDAAADPHAHIRRAGRTSCSPIVRSGSSRWPAPSGPAPTTRSAKRSRTCSTGWPWSTRCRARTSSTRRRSPRAFPTASAVERYTRVLERLAMPYAVDQQRRASPSQYAATTLTPASGLISTVRDFAQFDLALKKGVLLRPDTLALAWQAPLDRDGRRLPHGLGWFVQSYNGETIVWQFGVERQRLLVLVGDGARARADADPAGEQRRPGEAVRAGGGRSDGLAVRAAVPRTVCPVGGSAFGSMRVAVCWR